MAKKRTKYPAYKHVKAHSILNGLHDDYVLTTEEYGLLYEFFVTYSLCGAQSMKKRNISDYGWEGSITKSGLKKELLKHLALDSNENFMFLNDKDKTKAKVENKFKSVGLQDGNEFDFNYEHAVIGRTNENNAYFKLFYRIRDGFAHGRYILILTEKNEKMIIIQDNDAHTVSARIVIKLITLLEIIKVIDKNNILIFNPKV